ncbi:universal stress protein [Nonomuraea rubra]|uniref:universal stress protein n=1 Tax=Nonomuraea rubra TaxID=46180 RepID=UPI0033F926FC
MNHVIVVGADGSDAATAAVEWAAGDAARAGARLRVVHAVDRTPYEIAASATPDQGDVIMLSAQSVLSDAEAVARKRQTGIDVDCEPLQGAAAAVLRSQTGDSAEVVIGAGGLEDHHACEPALGYAFEQAMLRASTLRALYAWQPPAHAHIPESAHDLDEIHATQCRSAAVILRGRRQRYPQVPVIEDVRRAHPVDALVRASAQVDLVVVGSQGRGAIGTVMLGPVTLGVLHGARSSVAVVRP